MTSLRSLAAELHEKSPALLRATAVCVVLLGIATVGLLVDERVITGAPAWLKPAKFALSVSIYLVSIAFMVQSLPPSAGIRRASWLIAWLLVVEVLLIALQAARGTTSHFNVDSNFDGLMFSTMGAGIATVWVASMFVLWRHCRTPSADRAMAVAFRVGLALNIVAAGVGWRMTQPAPGQIEAIARGERPRIVGAHSVGGADGGAGMPLTKWSAEYGDLRVSHFVGMHALQLLPLLLVGLRALRRRSDDGVERVALYAVASANAVAFVAVLVQALRGVPLLPPPGS